MQGIAGSDWPEESGELCLHIQTCQSPGVMVQRFLVMDHDGMQMKGRGGGLMCFFSNLDFSQPWVGIAYNFTLLNCIKLGASIPHQEEVGTNKQILSCKCSSQCCLFE